MTNRRPRLMGSRSIRAAVLLAIASSIGACDREVASVETPDAITAEAFRTSVRLDDNTLTTLLDRREIEVGDPIRLVVIAEPEASRKAAIDFEGGELGPFTATVLPAPRVAGLRPGSAVLSVELDTFESGTVAIPPITARFEPRGGGVDLELASDPIEIEVASALADSADAGQDPLEGDSESAALRPIRGFVAVAPDSEPFWWISSVLASLVVLITILLLLRRRGPRAEPPPGRWAAERFTAALARIDGGNEREAWGDALATLRGWIERRFAVSAADRTSRELADSLKRIDSLDDAARSAFTSFLKQADVVLFANLPPGPQASTAAIRRLVEAIESVEAMLSSEGSAGRVREVAA